MRKSINNEDLVKLGKKAKYKKTGKQPEILKPVEDSFKQIEEAIQSLTSKLGDDVSSGNKAIIKSCETIIDSMKLYHDAVILTLENLPKPEKADMSKVESMHNMMTAVLTEVMKERPAREWDFDIQYDWKGDFDKIIAKEVKH